MSKTEIVRRILDKHNGQVTYGQVREQMEKAGIDANYFNVAKSAWKKSNGVTPKKRKSKEETPAPTGTALEFVTAQGSLTKAKEKVQEMRQEYETMTQEVAALQVQLTQAEQWVNEFEALAS